MKQAKLEDLIKEHIPFSAVDSRGWHNLKCQCCHDYKVRAGFKFDGGVIGFNCWNCATGSKYEEFSGKISKKMRSILNAYGIDDNEISNVVNAPFFAKKDGEAKTISLTSLKRVNTSTPTVQLPDKSFKLGEGPEAFLEYQLRLAEYLVGRKVPIDKYTFYYSLDPKMRNRIIIPYYRDGKLIYWQARSVNPDDKLRYLNAPIGREAVMFNMDQLTKWSTHPLFISEGVFDALMVDGVSLGSSQLNEAKQALLKKSGRRLIFVIDKDRNGRKLAEKVLKNGWEITFAPEGAEDLNESVVRFGSIWTIVELLRRATKDLEQAQYLINFNCGTEQWTI